MTVLSLRWRDRFQIVELRLLRMLDRIGLELDRFRPLTAKITRFAQLMSPSVRREKQSRLLAFEEQLIRQSLQLWREYHDERILKTIILILDIQLRQDEVALLLNELEQRPRCRLLVFGVGNDSVFWRLANEGGETVFLESSPYWTKTVLKRHPELDCRFVTYSTRQANWRADMQKALRFPLNIPDDISENPWDFILVDAPEGHHKNAPGRVQSISAASRLVARGGCIAVHDCDRPAEQELCENLLNRLTRTKQAYRMRIYKRPSTEYEQLISKQSCTGSK